MDLISNIVAGRDAENQSQKSEAPKLDFGTDEDQIEQDGEALRNKAMANLRERRLRLK